MQMNLLQTKMLFLVTDSISLCNLMNRFHGLTFLSFCLSTYLFIAKNSSL